MESQFGIPSNTLLHPPPWSDVYHLVNEAFILHILIIALALARTVLLPITSPSETSVFAVYDKDKLARWRKALAGSLQELSPLFSVIRVVLSFILCILYVVTTYMERIPLPVHIFQAVCGILFLVRAIFRLLFSQAPLSLVLKPNMMIESLSTASLMVAKDRIWLHFGFLQAFVVLWHWQSMANNSLFVLQESPVARKLTSLSLTFVIFIYVFACGFQLFELLGDPHDALKATMFELTIANALYLCVVTIFTVGYGDFVPETLFGRMWIVLVILFGAYLVARQVSQVIDVVASLRRGMGSFVKGDDTSHIVLCGNIKFTHLRNFIAEFYTVPSNRETKIVVMTSYPEWKEDQWNSYFGSSEYKSMVVYLEGNCTIREDLVRAQVETATAAFVMCNQHANDPYVEDTETLKRILMLRTYGPRLPIYAMCALKDSMLQFSFALENVSQDIQSMSQSGLHDVLGENLEQESIYEDYRQIDNDDDDDDDDYMLVTGYDGSSDMKSEALCLQEVESSLLAENIFCHGLSTLLSNLLLRVGPETKPSDSPWMAEYKVGAECRLEHIKLPSPFWGKSVGAIQLVLFDYGLVLIASKRRADRKWRPATLEATIHLNMIGLVVTYHGPSYLEQVVDHAAMYIKNQDSLEAKAAASRAGESNGAGQNSGKDTSGSEVGREPGAPFSEPDDPFADSVDIPVLSGTPVVMEDTLSQFLDDTDKDDSRNSISIGEAAEAAGLDSRVSKTHHNLEDPLNGIETVARPTNNPSEDLTRRSSTEVRRKRFAMSHQLVSTSNDLTHVHDHIVVCVLGRAGVLNIPHFMRRISMQRSSCRTASQIVAIGAHITERDEKMLNDQDYGMKLHIIRGPCMSLKCLKRAYYKRARAIVVLACEDSNDRSVESVDSKAIFTVITLDYLLGDGSSVFVCSTMDAEESMRLLRAPEFYRRTGSMSQRPLSRMSLSKSAIGTTAYGVRRAGALARHVSSTSIGSAGMSSLALSADRSSSSNVFGHQSFARLPSFAAGLKQNLQSNLKHGLGDEDKEFWEDGPKSNTFRNREEIYERQRYASGELVISSLYVAMLIREHAMPGLMEILCKIFGATGGERSVESNCWIRLVKVSEHWVRRAGRQRIFREAVETLLQHGCTPLGLYRTGNGSVRIEVEAKKAKTPRSPAVRQDGPPRDDSRDSSRFPNTYGSMGRVEENSNENQRTSSRNLGGGAGSRARATPVQSPEQHTPENVYTCPTTKHQQVFDEQEGGGENVLPYVYTFPEPFTLVDESDFVYVLAHPSLDIPRVW
eukprot:Plantae.Rhodophyta-Hildenbrandia_rubra.ctg9423.p1 GENE.Plantae.Rhodophyta-Hildenbrandia_rubra.ctg9423~~Plantae.Rhodophyta-Hildenbrandia_rubra.ctg9423.p1  ORF type:complete len:1282 (+),score=153.34 Plantae.Rhodophyta-Hildenbrandia_rubra.ctg9423:1145-4990(+)